MSTVPREAAIATVGALVGAAALAAFRRFACSTAAASPAGTSAAAAPASGASSAGAGSGSHGHKFAAINAPTAGHRFERELPSGSHRFQLYSMPTPNGQKVTIALEEMGLAYDAYRIDIMQQEQFGSGFTNVNPNSKIPAMIDTGAASAKPLRVFESGAILLYLAEQSGKLLPSDPEQRQECLNWLFFQHGAGPYFGQFNHFFMYADEKIPYAIMRYTMESQRLLHVLELQLSGHGKPYLIGDEFTIADCAWMPWVVSMTKNSKKAEKLGVSSYPAVLDWVERCLARPAVALGMKINSKDEEGGKYMEYHCAGRRES